MELSRAESISWTDKAGKRQTLSFESLAKAEGKQKTLLKNLQLNSFVNSIKCGYLEKLTENWLGMQKWEPRLCVLTNVGLLYFTSPIKPPEDLFPVLDCRIHKIRMGEVDFTPGYEAMRLECSMKRVTFRCLSKTDHDTWLRQIQKL